MTRTLSPPRNLSFLAYLAWPDGNTESHDRFIKSGMFLAYKAQGIEPRDMPPEITAIPGTTARKEEVINRGIKIIRERRIAAAYAFLRLSEGRRKDLFQYSGAETIGEALERWWSLGWPAGEDDPDYAHASDVTGNNARKRIWRESFPALPMTLALMFSHQSITTLFERMEGNGQNGSVKMNGPLAQGWPFLLSNTHWVDDALKALHAIPIVAPEPFVLPAG